MTEKASGKVSLGSQFLGVFNEIEGHFRHALDAEEGVPFGALLKKYSAEYRLPTAQYKTLKAMAALRNAISHGEYYEVNPSPIRFARSWMRSRLYATSSSSLPSPGTTSRA